jgi:hypothetical protein
LLRDESFVGKVDSVQTQTEFNIEEEIERRERELAVLEFNEEFGGNGHSFLDDIKSLSEREIVKRVRLEWRGEKVSSIVHYAMCVSGRNLLCQNIIMYLIRYH